MKKQRRNAASRAAQAIERAKTTIADAGWSITQVNRLDIPAGGRFVAVKRLHEREDESTTTLYESDYTIEGLAANVARREREESRK